MKFNRCLEALVFGGIFCLITGLSAEDAFEGKTFKADDGGMLKYQIHVPEKLDKSKKYPLVIFFHGAGERGGDNKKQLKHGVKDILAYTQKHKQPTIIIAPQCPRKNQWVNAPWNTSVHTMPKEISKPMKMMVDLMNQTIKDMPVDQDRIYVTGLSMGGFGTWDLVQRMPKTFAAAIPVCGGGDMKEAAKIKNLPIWVFHGGADKTVKTKLSQDMVAKLKELGSKVKYTEYPGVGHNSWTKTYRNEDVLKWLFSQKRSGK